MKSSAAPAAPEGAAASEPLQPGPSLEARYGGAAPLAAKPRPGAIDMIGALAVGSPLGHFVVVFVGSVGSFFVQSLFFTFLLFGHKAAAIAILLVFECTCIAVAKNRRRSLFHYPLGISCAVSAALGAVVGAYIYDTYGYFAYIYSRSRDYENVVPLERAGAVADAGGVVFADEAFVDGNMSAGYASSDGTLYCAAPVRGTGNSSTVEFWAVGTECCDSLGAFTCDSAGDSSAHGAQIVKSDGGLFRKSYISEYDHARRKAEANFNLASPGPLYVHWIPSEDVKKIAGKYLISACGMLFLGTLAFALISAAFIWILCRAFMESFHPHLDYGVF